MNQKQTIKDFKQFMKSRRAWSKWVRNVRASMHEHESDFLERYNSVPMNLIFSAFEWGCTSEGSVFWVDLYNQWLQRLTELEKSKQS